LYVEFFRGLDPKENNRNLPNNIFQSQRLKPIKSKEDLILEGKDRVEILIVFYAYPSQDLLNSIKRKINSIAKTNEASSVKFKIRGDIFKSLKEFKNTITLNCYVEFGLNIKLN